MPPHPQRQDTHDLRRLARDLSPEQLAELVDRSLGRRREQLLGAGDRDAMISELEWLQGLDLSVQVHLNQLAAAIYDGKHPKHWLWKRHKQWILDRVGANAHVLDVGCGCSAYLLWMAEAGCRVVAVDRRDDVLAVARRIMQHDNLRFLCADVMLGPPASPFGGAYDVAVCAHVIEHLEEPVAMLRSLRDVAPRLVVAVPPEYSRWQKLMHQDLGLRWKDDEDHRREYTPELLEEQLTAAGWRVDELHDGIDIKAAASLVGA